VTRLSTRLGVSSRRPRIFISRSAAPIPRPVEWLVSPACATAIACHPPDGFPCLVPDFQDEVRAAGVSRGMSAANTTTVTACDPADLPDDPALLKAMLAEALAALRASRQEGDHLRQRVDQLLRRLFGRRSERVNPDQLLLFAEPSADEAVAPPPPTDPSESAKPRRRGHGRQQLPEHLPRDRRVYELSEAERVCHGCGQARVVIGQEVSEQLDYEPASLTVIEHVRLTYACPCCEKRRQAGSQTALVTTETAATPFSEAELSDPATTMLIPVTLMASTFVTASRPPSPIARGLAGPGLLAHVIVSKFCDHLPLYRCERMLARFGVTLSRSTMCDWLAQSAALLRPLWELLKGRVQQSRVIQTDDTPVRVQAQAGAAAHQGRLWVQVGDAGHPGLVYFYSPNQEGQWPRAFLKGYKGFLQADAYTGYDALFATGAVVEVGCWAHARRKFFEAQKTDPENALYALGIIRQLYAVEREAIGQAKKQELSRADFEALRLRLRQAQSVPLLKSFGEWLDKQAKMVLPKSPLAEAIGYARNQWAALQVYTTAGFLEIDNNAAERALRPVAVGRKNYLFFGSDLGGETAAVLYSLVQTCRLLGVEPWRYLRDVLERLPGLSSDRLGELLPDRWASAQRHMVVSATGPPDTPDEEVPPGPS
jgi:transposase